MVVFPTGALSSGYCHVKDDGVRFPSVLFRGQNLGPVCVFASGVVIVRIFRRICPFLGMVFPAGGAFFSGGLRYPTVFSVHFRALDVLTVLPLKSGGLGVFMCFSF